MDHTFSVPVKALQLELVQFFSSYKDRVVYSLRSALMAKKTGLRG